MALTERELPLSRTLRKLRERQVLSQKDLAALLRGLAGREGLQRGEVSRWERGVRVPKPSWLAWLAVALDAPLAELDAARRAQLGGQQGDDAEPSRRAGGPGQARLMSVAEQVGTRFRDETGQAAPDVDDVDDLREAVRRRWLHRDQGPGGDTHLWPDGQVRGQLAVTIDPDGATPSSPEVTRPAKTTATRRLAGDLGWDQAPRLNAERRQEADEEPAKAQARIRVNPNARPDTPARVAGSDSAALVAAVVANRDDVKWLKRAVQAILDHYGIDAGEARDRRTDVALGQTEEAIRGTGREDVPSEVDE